MGQTWNIDIARNAGDYSGDGRKLSNPRIHKGANVSYNRPFYVKRMPLPQAHHTYGIVTATLIAVTTSIAGAALGVMAYAAASIFH